MRPTSATRLATASTLRATPSSCAASPPDATRNPKRSKPLSSKRSAKRLSDMPGETVPSLPDFGSLERGRFSYLPVVPGRVEFALEVRKRILETRPEVVAVELPETLESLYLDGIRRLPQISVIF